MQESTIIVKRWLKKIFDSFLLGERTVKCYFSLAWIKLPGNVLEFHIIQKFQTTYFFLPRKYCIAENAENLLPIIGQPPVTLQIGFCQPTGSDLFFVFFNSDFFPDFTLGQPGYNDMSHLAISIMLRRVRLIYFKRDNK